MGKGRDRGPRRRHFDDDEYSAPPDYANSSRDPIRKAPRREEAPKRPSHRRHGQMVQCGKGIRIRRAGRWLRGRVLAHRGPGTRRARNGRPRRKTECAGRCRPEGSTDHCGARPDASAATAPRPNRQHSPTSSSGRERPDPATASAIEGTVKWFNAVKGFGFAVGDDGQRDVFVHVSVVERAGLQGLDEGQRIAMKVVRTAKGREAISLALLR